MINLRGQDELLPALMLNQRSIVIPKHAISELTVGLFSGIALAVSLFNLYGTLATTFMHWKVCKRKRNDA